MTKYNVPLGVEENNPVQMLLKHIKQGSTVLEFGCANGRMTKFMREQLNCKVSVVEYDEAAIQDVVPYAEICICDDIMKFRWLEQLSEMKYDHIVFADVLEHLSDPEKVIRSCMQLLKEDGSILVSIPNIAHNDVLNRLWQDEFHYTETGLLDNTHIKFWAYNEVEPFFEKCGLAIVWEDAIIMEANTTEQYVPGDRYLAELRSRPLGNVYEFVLKTVRREYAKKNNIEKVSMTDARAASFYSRVYFDNGAGYNYSQPLMVYQGAERNMLSLKIPVAETTTQIRIDPAEACCLLEGVSVTDENGAELEYLIGNGFRTYDTCVFGHLDPQIYVPVTPKTAKTVCLQAKISFDRTEIVKKLHDLKRKSFEVGFPYSTEQIEAQLSSRELKDIYVKEKAEYTLYQWGEIQEKLAAMELAQQSHENKLASVQNDVNQSAQKMECFSDKVRAELEGLYAEVRNQLQKSAELNVILNQHVQEANAIISMLRNHQQECAELNSILQKQLRDTDDIIFLSKNIQHTTNDMLYVMQQTGWYRRAIRQIEKPSITNRIIRSLRNDGIKGFTKKFVKKLAKRLYKIGKKNKFVKVPLKAIHRVIKWMFPKWGSRINRTIVEARQENNQELISGGSLLVENPIDWIGEKPIAFDEKPLVSVIVPNFNHSAYLRDRLESVYNQTYPNFEVILLDDCSTDDSRSILMEYAEKYSDKTIVDFNETNGGKVFKQWNKGINHARGKLIWIAESDDWCDLDFLEKMVPQFEYQSVMLAFCRSIFMQDGEQIWTLEEYLSDISELNFDSPFRMSAHTAVRTAFGIKNIVPNVSSAMFRNVGQIPEEITNIWQNIKLCGDWLFYLHTIKGGTISYTNETTNYYRVHKNSTSLKIQKTPEYYQEQERISSYVAQNFDVDLRIFEKVLYNLEQHYQAINETDDVSVVHENYNLERIAAAAEMRRPGVLMCCYSLQMGGGETYPIFLANEMKRQGICVTLLNFNLDTYSQEVRNLLNSDVPLINLESPDYIGNILLNAGADVIHSHHASVDQMISTWLLGMPIKCRQVVSLHGMYETVDKENCLNIFRDLQKTCGQFVYTADKNLSRIKELGFEDKFPLVKVGNALPVKKIDPVDRETLGISEKDFVLCLVSRAIKDKGWQEAVDAVTAANRKSERKIHLIMIGDGPARKKLKGTKSPYIHVLGQKANIRDYFAMADMGFLPSAFHGESFPLVVIDSLMTGRPVLASNIGEIQNMLMDESGKSAGALFELDDWKIDVDALADQIVDIANDPVQYQNMVARVPSAMEKFDISKIVQTYLAIYDRVVNCKE